MKVPEEIAALRRTDDFVTVSQGELAETVIRYQKEIVLDSRAAAARRATASTGRHRHHPPQRRPAAARHGRPGVRARVRGPGGLLRGPGEGREELPGGPGVPLHGRRRRTTKRVTLQLVRLVLDRNGIKRMLRFEPEAGSRTRWPSVRRSPDARARDSAGRALPADHRRCHDRLQEPHPARLARRRSRQSSTRAQQLGAEGACWRSTSTPRSSTTGPGRRASSASSARRAASPPSTHCAPEHWTSGWDMQGRDARLRPARRRGRARSTRTRKAFWQERFFTSDYCVGRRRRSTGAARLHRRGASTTGAQRRLRHRPPRGDARGHRRRACAQLRHAAARTARRAPVHEAHARTRTTTPSSARPTRSCARWAR